MFVFVFKVLQWSEGAQPKYTRGIGELYKVGRQGFCSHAPQKYIAYRCSIVST